MLISHSLFLFLQVPIYVVAAALAVTGAYFSDRHGQRSPFIIGFMVAIGVGFIICIAASGKAPGAVYAGVFIAVCGRSKLPPQTIIGSW